MAHFQGISQRDKHSKLHIDDFERVLRSIGYKTMRIGKVEYSKDEILDVINRAKNFCVGLDFKPSDFLKDLVSTIPLMKKEGLVYKWSHKSLQDYFAARFILRDAGDRKNDILLDLYDEVMDDNVIDLFVSMDYKSFRHILIKKLLVEYRDYALKPYQTYVNNIEEDILIERIESTFGAEVYIKAIANNEIDVPENRLEDPTFKKFTSNLHDRFEKEIKEYYNYDVLIGMSSLSVIDKDAFLFRAIYYKRLRLKGQKGFVADIFYPFYHNITII